MSRLRGCGLILGDIGTGVAVMDAVNAKVGFGWEANNRGSGLKW